MHLKFDPTGIRIHDLQIMTEHFMSSRPCSNHLAISDFYLYHRIIYVDPDPSLCVMVMHGDVLDPGISITELYELQRHIN